MAIPLKSGNVIINESGTIPDLPDSMAEDVSAANWWFETRAVLNRQNDSVDSKAKSSNASFSTTSTSPYEYGYTHNRGQYPLVQVLDGNNQVASVTVTHNSINKFTVSANSPLTGTLIIH